MCNDHNVFLSRFAVLLEKILREQPDVGQVFLVIKGNDKLSSADRLASQVFPAPVFDRIRQREGDKYLEYMSSKVTAVQGDVGQDGLGFGPKVAEDLCGCVEIIVNSAATTAFDERCHF